MAKLLASMSSSLSQMGCWRSFAVLCLALASCLPPSTTSQEIADSTGWSDWSEPSECSRTCGGGVQYKERYCQSEECQGHSKIYLSCNVEDCAAESRDFRLEQCEKYNNVAFDGQYYEWIPYYGQYKCELTCLAKGETFYYRHAAQVVDGTRCDRHSHDVCVEGTCQSVGCDRMLGSTKQFDECQVCGGDGSTCVKHHGSLETAALKKGYNELLRIPEGATNIRIQEENPSKSVLALSSLDGEYYLNGRWTVSHSSDVDAAGTEWKYNRGADHRETLTADGPTTEALMLVFLHHRGHSSPIQYEFSMPLEVSTWPRPGYHWETSTWGECSSECGQGHQSRDVQCMNGDQTAPERLCDPHGRPSTNQTCQSQPCTAEWFLGEWGECSPRCGDGLQVRSVFCRQQVAGHAGTWYKMADPALCPSPRPAYAQPCQGEAECPQWEAMPWQKCNRVCGTGEQTRMVVCGDNQTDSYCESEDKPDSVQPCDAGLCQGAEWITSQWTGCEKDCEDQETRHVMCSSKDGMPQSSDLCDLDKMPDSMRPCEQDMICQPRPRWFSSQWSKCTAACGKGTQYRDLMCVVMENDTVTMVTEEECDADIRPVEEQECMGSSCDGLWYTGPYGKCSAICGGGMKKREVMCFNDNQSADQSACDDNTMPDREEDCNLHACDDDDLLVVGGCAGTQHGCCPDEATAAEGPAFLGCPPGDRIPVGLCIEADFGCCMDGVTPAAGPFNYGCPDPTCLEVEFGCCSDGQTPADGPDNEGCPVPVGCAATAFGCCQDGITTANGPGLQGCQEDVVLLLCEESVYGCCPDGATPATGADYEGCPEGSGDEHYGMLCENSLFGCCEDGMTLAIGPNGDGCNDVPSHCSESLYGCCPDEETAAEGPNLQGCHGIAVEPESGCEATVYGCCNDGKTAALGPDGDGCDGFIDVDTCESSLFGCCPDGKHLAEGPSLEGCETTVEACARGLFGCCPDGVSSAEGPAYEGCDDVIVTMACQDMLYGCCPDRITPAIGPALQGCSNITMVTHECIKSSFGCCPDGETSATGPQFQGCPEEGTYVETCVDSSYGCCPDGQTSAQGPSDAGCPGIVRQGAICGDPKERGSCTDYSIKWYFDPAYGGCTRFWYGGCDGNGNMFDTKEACQGQCVSPPGLNKCYLPASVGRCQASKEVYRFNPDAQQCETFVYGGCLGNDNRFETLQDCVADCELPMKPDVCRQPLMPGPCRGSFDRYFYDHEIGACRQFIYGGCLGNDNRFESLDACEERCQQDAIDVCTLPKDMGPCYADMRMYFFNTDTKACEQFTYGGCQGNANRFPSMLECENMCHELMEKEVDICTLPMDGGPCKAYYERWHYDQTDGYCKTFVYGGCEGNDNKFESEAACRQSCNAKPPVDVCSLPVVPGPCEASMYRYHFDTASGQCLEFMYGGCEGNGNNFETSEECEKRCHDRLRPPVEGRARCSLPVDTGPCLQALDRFFYDSNYKVCRPFQYGGCQGNRNRFMTIEACETECHVEEPTTTRAPVVTERTRPAILTTTQAVDVCTLPQEAGPCEGYFPSWYYDETIDECMEFVYGGCNGNGNRFESKEACVMQCRKRRVQLTGLDICSLRSDTGPCMGDFAKWHYDQESGECKTFTFGGCQGNENNFETQEECLATCPTRDVCDLAPEVGPCKASKPRYYFDPASKDCQMFIYGGCQGNANRFVDKDNCMRVCSPTLSTTKGYKSMSVCSLPKDSGPCEAYLPMWYYEPATGGCRQFVYGGCQGNENRFPSFEECEETCRQFIPTTTPVITTQTNDVCQMRKDPGPCSGYNPVWYFEPVTRTCRRFLFGGCDGNGNRFDNRDDCQATCLLRTTMSTMPPSTPSTTTPVPSTTHRVIENVDLCLLSKQEGPCQAQLIRWYFDKDQGRCLQFQYGGCNGNLNNFETEGDCEASCEMHMTDTGEDKRKDACKLQKDQGPCFADYLRYFYDDNTQECRPFIYGGCQGNDNNFDSQEECYHTCGYSAEYRFYKPGDCYEPQDIGPCNAAEPRWHFDATKGDCSAFYYGGCEGNGNNFRNYEDCIALCSRVSETCGVLQCDLDCPYGFSRGLDGCLQCKCLDPCEGYTCAEGMHCEVKEYMCVTEPCPGPEPVCRYPAKTGECPAVSNGMGGACVQECEEDAECPGARKCCSTGCGMSCMSPAFPEEPPVIQEHPTELEAVEGDVVTIPCMATGSPPPLITWYKAREPVVEYEDSHMAMLESGALEISGVTPEDATSYSCRAYNGVGSATRTYTLTVKVAAEFLDTPTDLHGKAGQPIELECVAIGNPMPTVRWLKDGQLVMINGHVQQTDEGSLVIESALVEDTGSYTCEANNGVGSPKIRILTVQVLGPLIVTVEATNDTYDSGADARLMCKVTGDTGDNIQVVWRKDGLGLPYDDRYKETEQGELLIEDLTPTDSGEFECIASRGMDRVSGMVYIEVNGAKLPVDCVDKPWYANCQLIVEARMCRHPYFSDFCCKTCHEAGLLP